MWMTCLFFNSNIHVVNNVKSLLFANFDMNDLGEAKVILGIKIIRFEKGIFLSISLHREVFKEI